MRINNLDELIQNLKLRLKEYLQMHDIDTSRHFFCINPEHEETVPSCSIVPSNPLIGHCFSCLNSFDIFRAAHWLEDLPEEGDDFVKITVPTLAAKFGLSVEYTEATDEEKYRIKTYAAYKAAAEYIASNITPLAMAEIERRGWPLDLVKEEYIGSVPDYRSFRQHLKSLDFEARFLDDIDLDRQDIFNENNLLFTVSDEYGKPVGFAARNLMYEQESKDFENNRRGEAPKKYINSKTGTGPKCNIYQKSKRLYMLHRAKKWQPPLYIVEGYSDAITLVAHGINNVAACGGTAFTDDHIDLLNQLKIREICLMLDGDEPGQKRMEKIIQEKFSQYRNFEIGIITIPDKKDPDDYIREFGPEEFLKLPVFTPFEWKLRRYEDREDPNKIVVEMIPLIITESSHIKREDMIRDLATHTGYSQEAILAEVSRMEDSSEEVKINEFKNVGTWISSEIKRNPGQIELILSQGIERVGSLTENFKTTDLFDVCLKTVQDNKLEEEVRPAQVKALNLGPNFTELSRCIEGNWSDSVAFFIGGGANAGKSLWLSQLAYNIAKHTEDVIVFVQTLDDNKSQWESKVLACIAQNHIDRDTPAYISINKLRNPSYYTQPELLEREGNDQLLAIRDKAYNEYMELIRGRKLLVVDATGNEAGLGKCPDFKTAITFLTMLRKKNPTKKIVWVLDNFHDLLDGDAEDEPVRVKKLAKQYRTLVKRLKLIAFASVEYTKLDPKERPNNRKIAWSVSLEYAASMIIHIYNKLNGFIQCGEGDLCDAYHEGKPWMRSLMNNIEKMPIVELIIGKNKITSVKNEVFYMKMYPDLGRLEGITSEEYKQIITEHQGEIVQDLNDDKTMQAKYLWNTEGLLSEHKKKWAKEIVQ